MMAAGIDLYLESPCYRDDLTTTRSVWAEPTITGTAGMFIFMTYLAVPALVAVRSGSGLPARSYLDGQRERAFLLRLLGGTEQDAWRGGIKNQRVRRQAVLLYRRHAGFSGMRPEYLSFMGAVIALAPLEARKSMQAPVADRDRLSYWRYMTHAVSLLGAEIGSETEARSECLHFIRAYAAPSDEAGRLLLSLNLLHPGYVERALPLLFGRARPVAEALMTGTPDG
jgi:hypothetical protein